LKNINVILVKKQYYIDNKEHINQQNRKNYYKNIEQRKEYYKNYDKTKKKEMEKSKVKCPLCDLEVTRYKLKDYYHNLSQTDEWKTKRKEKKTCDICGSIVRKMNISTHKKSQKCINAKK